MICSGEGIHSALLSLIERFKTFYIALAVYFFGTLFFTISAIPEVGRPFQIVGLFIGMSIVCFGKIIGVICVGYSRGGLEATAPVFMMDQLIGHDPDEDAVAGFFRTYVWTINTGRFCGAAVTSLLLLLVDLLVLWTYPSQKHHYWVSFLFTCISATIAGILFFVFRRKFVNTAPSQVNMLFQYGRIIHDAIRNKIYTTNIAGFVRLALGS